MEPPDKTRADNERFVSTCMPNRIASTLDEISRLATPVARSCHVGNNTSNVWGWLSLSANTRLVQFDHTRYGLDENCMPWLVLADYGRIEACYDHVGREQPEWRGRHVNAHLRAIPQKYFALLNYGIHTDYRDEDLILHHCRVARELSWQVNASRPSYDSSEAVSIAPALRGAIHAFADNRALHLVFDRWVRTTRNRKRYTIAHKIGLIEYPRKGTIKITGRDGSPVFEGGAGSLADHFQDGIRQVSARLTDGTPVQNADYPWFSLVFSYLAGSVKEFLKDPQQTHFWHAGGSSSQYYVNDVGIQARFDQTRDLLVQCRLLPEDAKLTFVPTYCCQLFATRSDSLALLDELLDLWRAHVRANRDETARWVRRLTAASHPLEVSVQAYDALPERLRTRLRQRVSAFNNVDPNRLPVAHMANIRHATYNKFGLSQQRLYGQEIRFPKGFTYLTWGEAELLIKVLAQQSADALEEAA